MNGSWWVARVGGFLMVLLWIGMGAALKAQDWRTASREPAGLAPDPAATREAVVQVYAARTIGWRGKVSVHTWIAVKPAGAEKFTVHELMGYQTRRTGNGVRSSQRAADMTWYGNRPWLMADVRGPRVDDVIARINAAVDDYPWARRYQAWPGPNSNTFVAHLLRAAPELRVDMSPLAIGKDYLGARLVAKTPSGTGVQVSVGGVVGAAVGWHEGVEVNVAGLVFGVSPVRLALKLPMVGEVGLRGKVRARTLE